MPSVTCRRFPSLLALFAVLASCRLPQLRCWVAPSSKAVCQAKPATPLLLPPLLGKPSACSTWPLFLQALCHFCTAGGPRVRTASLRSVLGKNATEPSGQPEGGPMGRWRSVCPLRYSTGHTLRRWEPFAQGLRPISVYPSNQPCHGPFRPGPRRPSASHTSWRSLPGSGSLRSPRPCAVKARQRPTRQTASVASAPVAALQSLRSFRVLGGLETQSREPASGLVGNGNVGGPIDRPAFETLNHQGLLGDLRPKVGA